MNILKIRTKNRLTADIGEDAAAKHLKKNGYKVVKRNYVANDAEIDVIATRDDILAFVEVKTRNIKWLGSKFDRPAAAVTPEKQKKIIKAASRFIGYKYKNFKKRFDVIEVYTDSVDGKDIIKEIRHLENTFDVNSAYRNGK
jgi:putative endonuclease